MWRCFDRQLIVENATKNPTSKLMLSPKDLIHCFGEPSWFILNMSTGGYLFEDNNLDLHVICEPNLTLFYREQNKADEYYENEKKHKHPHRRELKRLEMEEFWESDETFTFFLFSSRYAEYRKFKHFIRKQIKERLEQPSIIEKVNSKYGTLFSGFEDYNADYSKYNEQTVDKMAVFKHTWADYMTADEKKKYADEIPELPKPAQFVPLNKPVSRKSN